MRLNTSDPAVHQELDFSHPEAASGGDVRKLKLFLADGKRHTGKEIMARMGWKERQLRDAAEHADGAVLSAPGVPGYRLTRLTSVSDYMENERAAYMSQIKRMQERLIKMDRAVHSWEQ